MAFHVAYMAWTEPGRHWRMEGGDLDHPHHVYPGLHWRWRGTSAHMNLSLLGAAIRRRDDIWVVGGYDNPTSFLLLVVGRLARLLRLSRPLVLIASESNVHPGTATEGLVPAIKRWCLGSADGYVVPGSLASEAIFTACPQASSRPVFVLPNVVDESVFRDQVRATRSLHRSNIRRRLGVSASEQMWLLPARLEPFKGVRELIRSMAGIRGVHLVIAGSGPQELAIKRDAIEHSVRVTLTGQVDEARMVELYAASDLFVLPSLRDPSPLTAVEALSAGLPILLSGRAGNHPEVLANGNGWLYEPLDPGTATQLRDIASLTFEALEKFGAASSELFERDFNSERCVRAFTIAVRDWVEEKARPPRARFRA